MKYANNKGNTQVFFNNGHIETCIIRIVSFIRQSGIQVRVILTYPMVQSLLDKLTCLELVK